MRGAHTHQATQQHMRDDAHTRHDKHQCSNTMGTRVKLGHATATQGSEWDEARLCHEWHSYLIGLVYRGVLYQDGVQRLRHSKQWE
jgi:hypothetical protein